MALFFCQIFDYHIYIKVWSTIKAIEYLQKYVHKEHNYATFSFSNLEQEGNKRTFDETK